VFIPTESADFSVMQEFSKCRWYVIEEITAFVFYNLEVFTLCCRYAGLIVFSDVLVPRRPDFCNLTQGLQECLDGRCYRINKKCDGVLDCEDGTDEANCKHVESK
jgi:hypothetical protein